MSLPSSLLCKDSRTGLEYRIPIHRNAIRASDFKGIYIPPVLADRTDHVSEGLRVHDPGLQNTTVVETGISFSYVMYPCYFLISLSTDSYLQETTKKDCSSFAGTPSRNYGRPISRICCTFWCGGRVRVLKRKKS